MLGVEERLPPKVARICAQEAGRFSIYGLDRADVLQEATIEAHTCGAVDPAHIRVRVRGRLASLRRSACGVRRVPHDAWGGVISFAVLDEQTSALDLDAEQRLDCLRQLACAREALPEAFALLAQAFAHRGENGLHHARDARVIAARDLVRGFLESRSDYPRMGGQMGKSESDQVPACHAEGSAPEGYSAEETVCGLCADKFTCLPATVRRKLSPLTSMDSDCEVVALRAGVLTRDQVLARMLARERLIEAGQDVPPELDPYVPIAALVPAQEPAEAVKAAPVAGKPVKRLKRPPRADGPVEATAPEKPDEVAAVEPEKPAKSSWTMRKERALRAVNRADVVAPRKRVLPAPAWKVHPWLAAPRSIAPERMAVLLRGGDNGHGGVRIGQWFPLEVGHVLVRYKRIGAVRVTLRENGFEWAGNVYPSLSAAVMAHEQRVVSGNEFFNLRKSPRRVRVEDTHGHVLYDASRL